METPLHSSEQLREDLRYLRGALERRQQLHRRLLPLPGAIIPAEAVSALLILLVSLTAFVAGLSGFPMLFGVGLAMSAGLATRLLWPQSGWLLRVLVCGGLIGGALVERRAENK